MRVMISPVHRVAELGLSFTNMTCTCQEAELAKWFQFRTKYALSLYGECDGVRIDYFLDKLAPQCPSADESRHLLMADQSTVD